MINDGTVAVAHDVAPQEDDDEGVLQSAVWMAQDLGIAMPPVPRLYADRLSEVALGAIYASDETLLEADSLAGLTGLLEQGWPRSGLAFGYVGRGSGGRWFYALASEQFLFHVSLRLQHATPEQSRASLGEVSTANIALDAYFALEANEMKALAAVPPPHGQPRRIIAYTDADGLPEEMHALWQEGGEPAFVARREVFSAPPAQPIEVERVIWG
ncbi:hypothetical protein ASG43_17325 [Aureimonas sp. Leaf454]|uniref:hypothetical protein n=1 Tax=Aureimonas sp. Leaf454 TaxID=1736381 RepID=UPI0006F5409A|nr:hypothetical protein [Aureimonas sp. Leaf454]KQT42037.1 hypothetical protein ASG43_17325 [Aureimonas sp. Leaf454]